MTWYVLDMKTTVVFYIFLSFSLEQIEYDTQYKVKFSGWRGLTPWPRKNWNPKIQVIFCYMFAFDKQHFTLPRSKMEKDKLSGPPRGIEILVVTFSLPTEISLITMETSERLQLLALSNSSRPFLTWTLIRYANTTGHISIICSYFEFIKPSLFVRNLSPRQESTPRFSEHRAGAL